MCKIKIDVKNMPKISKLYCNYKSCGSKIPVCVKIKWNQSPCNVWDELPLINPNKW